MKIIMSVITLTVLTVLCSTTGMTQGENTPLPSRDEPMKTIITAIIALVSGAVSAVITAQLKSRELDRVFSNKVEEIKTQMKLQQEAEKQSQKANLRLQYVNPLQSATKELVDRIAVIESRMGSQFEHDMKDWFRRIKSFWEDRNKDDRAKQDFATWCLYEGSFAMATLHKSAVYFCYASQILQKSPFSELV